MSFEDAVRDVAQRSVPGSGFHVERSDDRVKAMSQIDSLLEALGGEIAHLHDVAVNLGTTLIPVLTPDDGCAEGDGAPDIPSYSPLAMRLVELNDRIRRERNFIASLDRRLEV